MVARPGQCGGALAAKRVRVQHGASSRGLLRACALRLRLRGGERAVPKMVWIWQGALHACFFWGFFGFLAIACVCMWRRTLVVGGGNRLGDARRAPTYAGSKLRACVCECVCAYAPAPLCRVPVCTTRLAFAGSNSAGRGTCCLARVCVRAFVFGFVLMQFLFFFCLLLICYCLVLGERRGWF